MPGMHKTNGAAQKHKALSGRKRKSVSGKGESNNHENVTAKQAKTIQGNGTSESVFQSGETKVENKTDLSQPILNKCITEAQFDANNIILDYNAAAISARSQDDILIGVSNSKTATSDYDDFVPLSQPARIKPNFCKRKTLKKSLTSFQSHKKDKTPGSAVFKTDLMTEASGTISLHEANISTRTSDTTGINCNVKTAMVPETNETQKTTVTFTSNSPGIGPGKSSHAEVDKMQRKTVTVREKDVVEEPFENLEHAPLGTINPTTNGTENENIAAETVDEVFPHIQKTVNLTGSHMSPQDEQQIIGNISPLQSRDNRAVMKEVSEIGTATAEEPERSTSVCEPQYSNRDCESIDITIAFLLKEGSTAQMQADMDISACEYRDTFTACEARIDTKSCKVGKSINEDATTTCVEPDNSFKTCSSKDNVTDHELCERNMDCKSADGTKSCSLVVDTSAIPGDSTMVSTPVICAMASNHRDCSIPDMAGDNTKVFKLGDNTTAIEPEVSEVLSQCIEELRSLEVPQIVGVKTVSQSDECPDITDSQLFQLGEDLMKEDQAGMGNGLECHYPLPGENTSSVDHSKTRLQSPAHALTAPQKLVQLRSTRDLGAAVPPQEKYTDTKETRMLKGLISELTSLNTMLMQFKREMDQQRHKRPNYLGTHKKFGR